MQATTTPRGISRRLFLRRAGLVALEGQADRLVRPTRADPVVVLAVAPEGRRLSPASPGQSNP
jgi:hypothetical protein